MARPFQDCAILLGDSLTSRQDVPRSLQARFSDCYRRTLDVLNRGFGGYKSSWVLPIMDRIFAKKEEAHLYPNIRLVTVWLGTNDSALPLPNETKSVPVEKFEANMREILSRLTSSDSPYAVAHGKHPLSIILITPPAINEEMRDKPATVTNEHTGKYREAVLRIGKEWATKQAGQRWKIATIDYFSALMEARKTGNADRFYTDGLHLATDGYDVLWREIDRVVHTDFKGRGIDWDDQQDLPWTEPDWTLVPSQ